MQANLPIRVFLSTYGYHVFKKFTNERKDVEMYLAEIIISILSLLRF